MSGEVGFRAQSRVCIIPVAFSLVGWRWLLPCFYEIPSLENKGVFGENASNGEGVPGGSFQDLAQGVLWCGHLFTSA